MICNKHYRKGYILDTSAFPNSLQWLISLLYQLLVDYELSISLAWQPSKTVSLGVNYLDP